MTYDVYDACTGCSEVQCAEVVFNAIHPITHRIFTIQYCKHLDLILTDDIKCAVGKVSCGFEQKARDAKLYG